MNLSNLEKVLKDEPKYRLAQVKRAVFIDLIEDWREAKFLPADLREKLDATCSLEIDAKIFPSKDGQTAKALIALGGGLKIETVLMRYEKEEHFRNTICVSSQVGCPLACAFCATGKMGFKRNLDKWEIAEQVLFFARFLKKSGEKITNVVFMGMGEPFLNYDNVVEAIKILNDKDALNLGARRFSISTSGVTEGIEKLANEKIEANLAISLHAPNDDLRSKLMPINKKYSLAKVAKAVGDYLEKTRRKVMFEYVMIKGVNDSDEHARELARFIKSIDSPKHNFSASGLCFVNFIAYNPTGMFKSSSPERIKEFAGIVKRSGIHTTIRYRFGRDVQAACGQLATQEE